MLKLGKIKIVAEITQVETTQLYDDVLEYYEKTLKINITSWVIFGAIFLAILEIVQIIIFLSFLFGVNT